DAGAGVGRDAATVTDDASASDSPVSAEDASSPDVQPTYDICPDGMAPTFPDILTRMFSAASCGSAEPYNCHSTTGALPIAEGGTGNLLDFSLDASAVYAELLGPDGGGHPSVDVDGDAGEVVLRVAPGDAGASMLYIKLAMTALYDPRYGEPMPPIQTVCPAAIEAVKAWIDDGAARQ
ncbi:MAG TPA: hypothetical protein VIY73_04240, partial [Polyangiaceae bacterium]